MGRLNAARCEKPARKPASTCRLKESLTYQKIFIRTAFKKKLLNSTTDRHRLSAHQFQSLSNTSLDQKLSGIMTKKWQIGYTVLNESWPYMVHIGVFLFSLSLKES